jgi:hypothetical protein
MQVYQKAAPSPRSRRWAGLLATFARARGHAVDVSTPRRWSDAGREARIERARGWSR